MALGKVMESRERGGRSILLYDFVTNHHDLLAAHRSFLDRFAAESHSPSVTWSVVGLASRLGDRTQAGRDRNRDLSWNRAREVNGYLLARNMRANGVDLRGLSIPTLNTRVAGVGTRFSDTTSDINSEFNRAVVIWNNVGIPDFTIEAVVPPAATTEFFIKYVGSGAGGLPVATGHYAQFAIRDGRDYWQRYSYGGLHVGVGAPVAWGQGLPAGQGWVSFRTRSATTVDSFSGWAQVGDAGAQAGPAGASFLNLSFGIGRGSRIGSQAPITVTCPTGEGFAFGASAGIAAGMIAVGDREHGGRWRWL